MRKFTIVFKHEGLNTMVNIARILETNGGVISTSLKNELVELVQTMKYSKAKNYLESVITTWFILKKPGIAHKQCIILAFELAGTLNIQAKEENNLRYLEGLAKASMEV